MPRDLFSTLPAPLPLYILLELSDLKALHAAILASPHLLAVFRLDACLLFKTIIRRTLPDDHAEPMLSYMRLYKASFDGSPQAFEDVDLKSRAEPSDALELILKGMPTSVVFRTLVQATRIHDLAHFILGSKLDYLPSLRHERLADPCFTYDRRRFNSTQTPEGIPIDVPPRLAEPSWIEENRAIRALWLLAVRCGGSKSFDSEGQSSAEEFASTEHPWMDDEVEEVEASLTYGPTLLPPRSASGQARNLSDTLRPYPIPHPPYRRNTPILPSPCFSRPPATIPVPSAELTAWEQDISYLSKENRTTRYLEYHNNHFGCPLQGLRPSVFARLGFNFWDRQRVSAELRLRAIPATLRPRPLDGQAHRKGEPGWVNGCEDWYRLFKLYEDEESRMQQGWKRRLTWSDCQGLLIT